MKKILFSVMSAALLTTVAIAQQEPLQNQPAPAANYEHLIMKDGKMYHNMNGKEMVMQNQMMLRNGTVMHTDGSYQLKNGKHKQLRNGHCMDMNGRKYRSHQMFQRTMMRMHGSGMHSGGQHGGMMGSHH